MEHELRPPAEVDSDDVSQLQREHVTLAQRERERVRALGDLLASVSCSPSVDDAIRTLLDVTITLTGARAAAFYLLAPDQMSFVPYGSEGVDLRGADPRAFTIASSLAGRAVAEHTPQALSDTSTYQNVVFPSLAGGQRPCSVYNVPIHSYAATGVLEIYFEHPREFDPGDQAVFGTLAAAAGIALANARQYDEQVQRRRQAEDHAKAAAGYAARLDATIKAMSDGVWMCDRAGTLVAVNDAGLRMLGIDRAATVGQSIDLLARLVCPAERPHLGLRAALAGEAVRTECQVQVRNQQPRVVDISATPIYDDAHEISGAVTVVRDITRAKEMDRLRDDFLSIAAHELKTPITALKGYVQLVLKRVGDHPELENARRFLEMVDQQADRITSLVQKLLDAGRIHAGKLDLQRSTFDLQGLLELVAERMQQFSLVHTIIVAHSAPVMVHADQHRIEQVLINLVDNAIKYSPGGGPITLDARLEDAQVVVSVRDEGLGIPVEKLSRVFDRWYQAHAGTSGDFGGMGLGLSICKEIVEQHGGRIWAEAAERGSHIRFTLPLAAGADRPASAPDPVSSS